ncbi:MAG: HAMP domain-containing histidine kinase [bacterium]|nr:HAMP domain-containing histidine kinase [bacterium]
MTWLCYGLLALAWVIDIFTPQLFVAAILLDGPIALSALALRPQLTVRLMILAEVANLVSGYVNGVQAGFRWDSIALGDRLLAAASFVLVGVLTIRAQESARRAGESDERARQIERERALRHALEHVRASLNHELILRAAVREARLVSAADRVTIVSRASALDVPELYDVGDGDDEMRVSREALSPEIASLVERARSERRSLAIDADEPLGRLIGDTAVVASLPVGEGEVALVLRWRTHRPTSVERAALDDFVANLGIAIEQAQLFVRLAEQNAEIARQKDALQQRSDVIRDIVYALAHDLRTPIVAADVTLHQALDGAYGELPERYVRIARSMLASNAEQRRMVETLLLVARYEAGEDARDTAAVGVRDVLRRVLDELSPLAEVRGVRFALARDAADATLVVNADELRRAVANLAANAIEATPEGGEIALDVRRDASTLTIAVFDDGYGVPPERRARLFERFAGVRAGGGTGLGLYIVRRIAEKYGGRVAYEPRVPQGSIFRLELPLEGASA